MSKKKINGVPFCKALENARNAVRIKPATCAQNGAQIQAEQTNVRLRNLLAAVITKATKSAACQVRDVEEVAQSWLSQETPPARTGDQIVYKSMQYSQDGARCIRAGYTVLEAAHLNSEHVVQVVIHFETAKDAALRKLDGVDRLVLGL